MKQYIEIDFEEANQAVAALADRENLLALLPHPDPIVARAMAACITLENTLRAAFDFPSEAALDATHEASVAELVELKDAEFGEGLADVPLADWPEADKAGVYGR